MKKLAFIFCLISSVSFATEIQFELRVDTTRSLTVHINQDNLAIKQVVNSPGSTTITINQSN